MTAASQSRPLVPSAEPEASVAALGSPGTGGRMAMANTAVLAAYTVFETCIVFLFTLAVARYLGAGEFGRLGFALSYALLTSVLAVSGNQHRGYEAGSQVRRKGASFLRNQWTQREAPADRDCSGFLIGALCLQFLHESQLRADLLYSRF